MKLFKPIFSRLPVITKYRYKLIIIIALTWVFLDAVYLLIKVKLLNTTDPFFFFEYKKPATIILREIIVLGMSAFMVYLIVFPFKKNDDNIPLGINFLLKTLVLLFMAFLMSFLIHFTYSIFISKLSVSYALREFAHDAFNTRWLLEKIPDWILIFLLIQITIEMIEKYSPGIFFDILLGKYLHPRIEERIVMFIDLKDSTPIAEKLGHQNYFYFIRNFIAVVSTALIEYNGRIYQYVGDEIVVSWYYNAKNARKCMDALIEARKQLQRREARFKRLYGVAPDFRVGIHVGEVTVGEIGVIKKDLAMSGDTMNTTARIRDACSELNHKFIVSKEVIEALNLKHWQSESLGMVDLKGKNIGIELFALKV